MSASREEKTTPLAEGAPEAETPATTAPARAPASAPPPAEDWQNRYLYLLAEFDNYRKRVEREREQKRLEAKALLLRRMLPLHDAFEQAEAAFRQAPPTAYTDGLQLLFKEWARFLAAESFKPVARIGEKFRPEEEESVGEVPADAARPEGTVAEIVQQGYRTDGGLLRSAKVIVARGPSSDEAELDWADEADGSDLPDGEL